MIKNKIGLVALSSVVCMLSFGSAFAGMKYDCAFVANNDTKFYKPLANSKSEAESMANEYIRSNYPNGHLKYCK